MRRLLPLVVATLALAACAPVPTGPGPGPSPSPAGAPLAVRPLPGGLDRTPVLHSNSPEAIQGDGILVSTLAGGAAGGGAHLDHAFEGDFEVFSHHVADQPKGRDVDGTWLGLLARNTGTASATIALRAGASWLSRPDAPYLTLAPVVDDPDGQVFAGPGSRVATDLVRGRSPLAPRTWTLAPGETRALYVLPVPTTNGGVPNRNGRSGLFRFTATGAVRLGEVSLYGKMAQAPADAALSAVWDGGVLATPRDAEPTAYDPASPPTGGAFRYGRVAGVAVGARWAGTLFDKASDLLPAPGARVGFPIASVVLNTAGTHQVQAPVMARRYPDTAIQAHGSYGVTYALELPLDNPDAAPRAYAIALVSPLKVDELRPQPPVFRTGTRVTFRGPVRVDWEGGGAPGSAEAHVVLHEGEDAAPVATVPVPPGGRVVARLTLVYPADCTPPQLVTVGLVSR